MLCLQVVDIESTGDSHNKSEQNSDAAVSRLMTTIYKMPLLPQGPYMIINQW